MTVDCQYVKPGLACGYVLSRNGEAAVIETGTVSSVPAFLRAIEANGLALSQVRYVIITHVHLDHAGGAAKLLEQLPNATLLCHPRAARHVIDPSRLIQSSIAVYGEELFRDLYGEIPGADEKRVQALEDEASVELGGTPLRFLHTRGHANHHFCIYDEESNGVFTGDSFGIGYRVLQEKGPFLFPSSTPTDFDPEEARKSVHRIADTGCDKVYLTHFGQFDHVKEGREQMLSGLDYLESLLVKSTEDESVSAESLEESILNHLKERAEERGITVTPEIEEFFQVDSKLNAQGIHFAASRKRKKEAGRSA